MKDEGEWETDCGAMCLRQDCRAPILPCEDDTDCGPGTTCSSVAPAALGILSVSSGICWNATCEVGTSQCGSLNAVCGRCLCQSSCEQKQCGDEAFDGCNGQCANLCTSGQPGCRHDLDCPADHVCLAESGAQYGYGPNESVCVPDDCLSAEIPQADCGHEGARCGLTCAPAHVPCQGMTCGNDPVTGVACGSCDSHTVCNLSNTCVPVDGGPSISARTFAFEVGATPGMHEVTPLGHSMYRIPLRLPPGAGGLTPELALAFHDSSNMRGPLGPGWSLIGPSRIHRCSLPATQLSLFGLRPQEPLPTSLCLDGRPLRVDDFLTEGENDPDVIVYTLSDNDGSKIVHRRSESTFDQFMPDGQIHRFGTDEGSRRRIAHHVDFWYLAEISDRFGNKAVYNYESELRVSWKAAEENAVYLKGIEYSIRTSGSFSRRISFAYREKEDALGRTGGYVHGGPSNDGRLLEAISVDTFDGIERHANERVYRVHYSPTPGNGIERVDRIQECTTTDSGEKCLPPTLFEYDDGRIREGDELPRRFNEPRQGVLSGGHVNFIRERGTALNQAIPIDADGDGDKDLLLVDQDLRTLQFMRAERDSDGRLQFGEPTAIDGPDPSCVSGATVVDLDGDGRDEIIDGCPLVRQKKRINYFHIDITGSAIEKPTNVKALGSVSVGDLDGNGRPDLIQEVGSFIFFGDYSETDEDGMMRLGLYRVDAAGSPSPENARRTMREPFFVDVDGDGILNLLRFDYPSKQFLAMGLASDADLTTEERETVTAGVIDDPEDERVVFYHLVARWRPTGLSYQVSPLTGGPGHFDSVRVLDLNGDGLDDVWVQSFVLLAPLDPNLGRIPDILTGYEPNLSNEIVRINEYLGQFFPQGLSGPAPAQIWINVGGTFRPKIAIGSTTDGVPVQCDTRTSSGECPFMLNLPDFRGATVLDYDGDGRTELLTPWRRYGLEDESGNHVRLFANSVPDLPASPDLYVRDTNPNPWDRFESYPVWADFDGDANLDMVIAGYDDEPEQRLLVLGTGQGNGQRLKNVTDGLGNRIDIRHTRSRSDINMVGDCGEPFLLNRPRCLRSMGAVVRTVDFGAKLGDSGWRDYGAIQYKYEHPATADFLNGYYFTSRILYNQSDSPGEGIRPLVSTEQEFFSQALENGTFVREYSYPFLTAPSERLIWLSEAEDLSGMMRGRTVREENEYRIALSNTPYLSIRRRTTFDRTDVGDQPMMSIHEGFDVDVYGLPTGYQRSVYFADWYRIAHSEIDTFRDQDRDRWILDKVERSAVTHVRGSLSVTKETFFEHDEETGFVREIRESRPGDDRDLWRRFTPDSFGNVAMLDEISNEQQRLTQLDYGSSGIYPQQVENAEGHVERFEFDDTWGQPTLIQNANGFKILQTYDGFGRLVRRESRNGDESTLLAEVTYSAVEPYTVGNLQIPAVLRATTASDLFSGNLSEDFDTRGLSVRSKAPGLGVNGNTPDLFKERAYDWAGRITAASRAHLDAEAPVYTLMTYDVRGRPVSVASPNGDLTYRHGSHLEFAAQFPEWSVPDALELTHVTDANGRQTATIFDHQGEVVLSAEGMDYDAAIPGFVSRVDRGSLDLPITLIDPEQHQTSIRYDADGLVTSMEDENRGRTEFEYDAFGNLRKEIRADLVESVYTYDRLDRLRTRRDAGTDLSEWTYDLDVPGTLSVTVGPTGVRTEFGYEDSPRAGLTSVKHQIGDETFTTDTELDRLGRPTRIHYPTVGAGGQSFRFAVRPVFDSHSGQQVGVKSDDGETNYWRVASVDYAAQTVEVRLGNGVRERHAFDPATGRIKSVSTLSSAGSELARQSFAHDVSGLLLQRNLTHGNETVARTFSYDSARRIETVIESGARQSAETFDFTPSGRLASRSKLGSYVYEPGRPHAVASVGNNEFGYDDRGNQITRSGPDVTGGEQTLSYNRFNLPDRIDLGPSTNPEESLLFEYDAGGNRVARRATESGVEVLSSGDLYERSGGIGTPASGVHKFRVFANGREVAQVLYDQSTETFGVQYLHRDHLTSVIFTSDEQGQLSALQDLDVFGAPLEDPSGNLPFEAFGGHELDPTHGLLYGGARLYDPKFGTFASPDPLRSSGVGSQAFNPYAYANNDPVNWFDPSGFAAENPTEVVVRGLPPAYPDYGYAGVPGAVWYQGSPTVFVFGCRGGAYCPQSSIDAGYAASQAAKSQAAANAQSLRAAFLSYPYVDTTPTLEGIAKGQLEVAMFVMTGGTGKVLQSVLARVVGKLGRGWGAIIRAVGGKTAARGVNNAIPKTLARVIPGKGPVPTLGPPGRGDVFVTAAEDIAGMNPTQIAQRLGIPQSEVFTVVEFGSAGRNLASPILRGDPGFVGRGLTSGGAREFVLPNGPIPADAVIRMVGP